MDSGDVCFCVSNCNVDGYECYLFSLNENNRQLIVILCREIILSNQFILASPGNRPYTLLICAPKDRCQCGSVFLDIAQHGLIRGPFPTNLDTFERCLRNTVYTRMSPRFKPIGNFLTAEKEFLLMSTRFTAHSLSFHVVCGFVYVSVATFSLLMPSGKFSSSDSIEPRECFVLPSLKRASIVEMVRLFPPSDKFRTYLDMKNYWRDSYGYELPINESNIFFAKVNFEYTESTFTYPSCCIRNEEPLCIRKKNPSLSKTFCDEVMCAINILCGFQTTITSISKCPSSLNSALNGNPISVWFQRTSFPESEQRTTPQMNKKTDSLVPSVASDFEKLQSCNNIKVIPRFSKCSKNIGSDVKESKKCKSVKSVRARHVSFDQVPEISGSENVEINIKAITFKAVEDTPHIDKYAKQKANSKVDNGSIEEISLKNESNVKSKRSRTSDAFQVEEESHILESLHKPSTTKNKIFHFLKAKGIKCCLKEKKEVLIAKVLSIFSQET